MNVNPSVHGIRLGSCHTGQNKNKGSIINHMKKLTTRSMLFCLLSLPTIISCKNGPGHTRSENNGSGSNNNGSSPGDKKYQFGIQLVKGDKYYYTIKNEIQTKLEVNDKKTETSN